ncbi:glycosyltransferase [Gracilimonas mengyeensis]|uniref:Glycosyltransferase involved in cell wall bisynthesis n=1 Tax=Gracilimonas mengyeensis TaxID=1302730 RepID=A0A521AGP5_9BACT|nr:glycosyltransferase [Gracilimonas mengyeensis]SMO33984.1 Glycosyltransferase involved in cell wall bisynthesis [Gracilimonas mengyeensis]
MKATSLDEVYASVNAEAKTIYVVPLIRYSHKKSDYLYLLYQDLIESDRYQIESISIFNHVKLIFGALINKNVILHYHWLEFQDFKSLAGMPWKMACIFLFKIFGGNIVWTLHNEFPHDQKYLELHQFLHRRMAKWADALHVHCQKAVDIMSHRLRAPKSKFHLVPHPDFPAMPSDKKTGIAKINEKFDCTLSPDISNILMFGNISRYKQIEEVARIVTDLDTPCNLLIVGPVKKGNQDLYEELKELAEQNKRIVLIPHFIDEEEVPWFYHASDICVFNYREILSSGGYHMAQAYDKLIIAPDMGCLSEEVHHPNVHLFHRQDGLKALLNVHLKALQEQ